ncbi:MAG TPA: hypothetical protein VFU07_04955 [Candidatus Lumbricidophila sp.]|nr:hypothetical protein [Candidatus Lumbricidophila sp.]
MIDTATAQPVMKAITAAQLLDEVPASRSFVESEGAEWHITGPIESDWSESQSGDRRHFVKIPAQFIGDETLGISRTPTKLHLDFDQLIWVEV